MGLLIKRFDNNAQYETFTGTSEFIVPNISYTLSEHGVHYNPYVDPYAGHDYVEIGGLKWATMNVGANSVTDNGLYFQWGDISGYTSTQVGTDKVFNVSTYKYYADGGYTKYNSTDGKTVLDVSDDSARANWGGAWRMPTTAEFQALGNAVNTAWTNDYQSTGVKGLVCTAKDGSGAVLFFPAAGYAYNSAATNINTIGDYWSSSSYDTQYGWSCYFKDSSVTWGVHTTVRPYGFIIRPVIDV